MQHLFLYSTSIGTFYIARSASGSFHALYGSESLGTYERPEQAAQDLAAGTTYPFASGEDTSKLAIPADLREWNAVDDL